MLAVRSLGVLERFWLAGSRLAPHFVIQCVLEGAGELELPAWERAWSETLRHCQGARLQLRGMLTSTRWVESDVLAPLRVLETPWEGDLHAPFLHRELDPWRSPPIELVLSPGPRPKAVLRAHHALTDGRGLQLLAETLMSFLDGVRPPDCAGGPQRDLDLSREEEADQHPRAEHPSPLGPASATEGPGIWVRRRYQGPSSRLLPRALAAAWEASRSFSEGSLRLEVPVDLRPRGLRSTANLAGIVGLQLERSLSPEELSQQLRAQLAQGAAAASIQRSRSVSWLPLWLLASMGRAGVRRCRAKDRFPTSMTVSTMGRVSMPAGGAFLARRWWFTPPCHPGLPMLMVLTGHPEGVEICAASPDCYGGGGRLEDYLDAFLRALHLSLPSSGDAPGQGRTPEGG